jgi:hypothetical protein
MKTIAIASAGLALALALAAPARADGERAQVWDGYLDYAYVYTSEEPEALGRRLAGYGREAGLPLDGYAARLAAAPAGDDAARRRLAIAQLLLYLETGDAAHLERSVEAVRALDSKLGQRENRYWHHTVLAHEALEKGRRYDFVGELLDLWLEVIAPMETPYESLQKLSLGDSPSSGFVAALPHLQENVARLVLIRSQQMGIDDSLDPLAALVRLLDDGRIGAHPDVIPVSASSRDYLDRVLERLNGPESDAGSLTFTLALFEATSRHDEARALLAAEGFGAATLEAMRAASSAYETALNRADTLQGQCAVYTRVLRQIGEVYAAKQRLGVDPEIETPFSIEGAIAVYGELARGAGEREDELGYGATGHDSFVAALHGLWEEIQEATLNAASYYLAQSVAHPQVADEHSRNAARLYARYLAFFHEHAQAGDEQLVPDSAYFAAYEAAKGYGDALLRFAAGDPSEAEIERVIRRYQVAMRLFPFDRALWPALTDALARAGREREYLGLVQPVAESVTRSRSIDRWIERGEPGAEQIASLRNALSDSLVIMHLGFADAEGIDELERGLEDLRLRRLEAEARLATLERNGHAVEPGPLALIAEQDREREMTEAGQLMERLDQQIAARSRALPLYREAVAADGLAGELRARRDHPGHALLRRLYHENRS